MSVYSVFSIFAATSRHSTTATSTDTVTTDDADGAAKDDHSYPTVNGSILVKKHLIYSFYRHQV